MNEYDQWIADMADSGRSEEELEAAWNVAEDPFCLPAVNADVDFNASHNTDEAEAPQENWEDISVL